MKSCLFFVLVFFLFPMEGFSKTKKVSSSLNNRNVLFHPDWRFIRSENGVFTYKLKKDKSTLGVFQSNESQKRIEWNKIGDRFFSQVAKEKKELMKMIQVFDWNVKSQSWKKKKDHFELRLTGSYTDRNGEIVFFQEFHFYYPRKMQQILLTSPNSNFFKTSSAKSFIREFRKARGV